MDRREFLKQTALGVGALSLGNGLFGCVSPTAEKPNILLIMVDDMGFSDLGCYGSEIPTPNIDKLAQDGVRFTQFYNAARCCPSRACLLTGVYPHQAGIGAMVSARYGNPAYQGYLNNQSMTIAEVLKGAGYSTYMSGKWHVPGETLEDGETDEQGLIRGIMEEAGVEVRPGKYLGSR